MHNCIQIYGKTLNGGRFFPIFCIFAVEFNIIGYEISDNKIQDQS